jgi:hypothetical protein
MEIKRQYPDIELLKSYVNRLNDAVIQLDSTEQQYPEDTETIKLLLLYERFYFTDAVLRPVVVEAIRSRLRSNRNIYFLDIGEFEWFIEILGSDGEEAEAIIDKKKELEAVGIGSGIDFWQVIPKVTDHKRNFIFSNIDHWSNYIKLTNGSFSR